MGSFSLVAALFGNLKELMALPEGYSNPVAKVTGSATQA